MSGCSAPPTKARQETRPSGARPANFTLLKVQASVARCSMKGTTKPKPSTACLMLRVVCEINVAVEA